MTSAQDSAEMVRKIGLVDIDGSIDAVGVD